MNPVPAPRPLSLKRAATKADVSRRTLRRWIEAGSLPYVATADGPKVLLDDVQQLKHRLCPHGHVDHAVGPVARLTADAHTPQLAQDDDILADDRIPVLGTASVDMRHPPGAHDGLLTSRQLQQIREQVVAPLVALTEQQQSTIAELSRMIGTLEAEIDRRAREVEELRTLLAAHTAGSDVPSFEPAVDGPDPEAQVETTASPPALPAAPTPTSEPPAEGVRELLVLVARALWRRRPSITFPNR